MFWIKQKAPLFSGTFCSNRRDTVRKEFLLMVKRTLMRNCNLSHPISILQQVVFLFKYKVGT